MAAMHGEISSSSLEHLAQVGELGVPPRLCCQPVAAVPSARSCVFAHPLSCLPCCHGLRRRRWQVKACWPSPVVLHALLCMAAPAWLLLVWHWDGQ